MWRYLPNEQRKSFDISDFASKQMSISEIDTFKILYTICTFFFFFNSKSNVNVMFFAITVITSSLLHENRQLSQENTVFQRRWGEKKIYYKNFPIKTTLINLLTLSICLCSSSEWLVLCLLNCIMINWDRGLVSYVQVRS